MKFTKDEAHEYLRDIKVFAESMTCRELIQKKLFECGFSWDGRMALNFNEYPFLFTDENHIHEGGNLKWWSDLSEDKRLIKATEIIEIEIVPDSDVVYYKGKSAIILRKIQTGVDSYRIRMNGTGEEHYALGSELKFPKTKDE